MEIISRFNGFLPQIEDVQKRLEFKANIKLSEYEASKYLDRMKMKATGKFDSISIIENLIEKTNIWEIGVGTIDFHNELKIESSGTKLFASFDEDEYQFGIVGQKVVLRLRGAENEIIIFRSQEQFVDFLLFYHRVHYDIFYRGKTLDKEIIDRKKYWEMVDESQFIIKQIFNELPIYDV